MIKENLNDLILFGTLKVKNKKEIYILKECVFSINDKNYKSYEIIEIVDYKKIGIKNNTKRFTEVKGSDEKRNKITGAYE